MEIVGGKNLTLALLISAVFALMAVSDLRAGGEVPKTKAGHLAIAEKYEKLAADQEAIVKEHTEMKQDYRAGAAVLPKQTREKSTAEMERHCDALISAAR